MSVPFAGSRTNTYLAHARPRPNGSFDVHEVEQHLRDVADLAAEFAAPFGSSDWAQLAGLWHDLGKYHPEFQRYIAHATGFDPEAHLEGSPGRVDHSTLGAVHALEVMGDLGRIPAYLIAGHHAGLPDYESAEQGGATLVQRRDKNRSRLADVVAQPVPADVLTPELPCSGPPSGSAALWIRMLFSCLVDADFLDTEAFLSPERAQSRGGLPELAELHERFNRFMEAKTADVVTRGPVSPVNSARADVLRQCREKAAWKPGLFSLSVPTGGGKTLSSLAWALEHARHHGKRRIIYVIPYTSIIEQTADVFRGALGDTVVEHHSNLEPEQETAQSRVASENWDAPLVVTTGVQFWESLFAARTSRARKLHNIVNSVVVLDEAQTLPPEFLLPILDAMRDLQASYGVSFLLCTATQPALEDRKSFDWHFKGLTGVREIIDNPAALHDTLKRVELEVPENLRTPVTWTALADELAQQEAVLCIVNRRDDAQELFQLLPEESRVHLSALMCGKHRSETIQQIKHRLAVGEPIHLVSTQLVEAGVDLDFPTVFRALTGLDSIAQAAGRCNREGKRVRGRVVVFVPPRPAPAGLLRMAEDGGRQSLEEHVADPLAPERFRAYFQQLYWKQGSRLDQHGILGLLDHQQQLKIQFRTAAERFRLIPDLQLPTVVRYHNERLLQELWERKQRGWEPDRLLRRQLQRFIVTVPRYVHQQLAAAGHIAEWHPGVWVQEDPRMYHPELGLRTEQPAVYEAADLIA